MSDGPPGARHSSWSLTTNLTTKFHTLLADEEGLGTRDVWGALPGTWRRGACDGVCGSVAPDSCRAWSRFCFTVTRRRRTLGPPTPSTASPSPATPTGPCPARTDVACPRAHPNEPPLACPARSLALRRVHACGLVCDCERVRARLEPCPGPSKTDMTRRRRA